MNRLNLIEMARKAISEEPYAEVALPSQNTVWMMGIVQLEKFAALVAAHEREACIKTCESLIATYTGESRSYERGVEDCAFLIRGMVSP